MSQVDKADRQTDLVARAGTLILDPDLLKPSDLTRAKTALAEIVGDRDPMTLADPTVNEFGEWFAFMIWCFRSRTNPSYTWEQAQDVPFGEARMPMSPPPPPTAEPTPNGSGPGNEILPAAKPSRASAATTGSAKTPTSG